MDDREIETRRQDDIAEEKRKAEQTLREYSRLCELEERQRTEDAQWPKHARCL